MLAGNPAHACGGVDLPGHTREPLLQRVRQLGVKGCSSMDKAELARALARKQG